MFRMSATQGCHVAAEAGTVADLDTDNRVSLPEAENSTNE